MAEDKYEIRYTDKGDFFDSYPDYLALREVKAMLNVRGKDGSQYSRDDLSKMLWAIYFIYHPNSMWIKQPISIRIEFVNNDWINIKGWWAKANKNPEFIDLVNVVIKLFTDNAPERYLLSLWDKLDQRNELIRLTDYEMKNFEQLDRMILASNGIVTEIKRVEAALHNTNERIIKGGKELTKLGKDELHGTKKAESTFARKALEEAKRDIS